MVKPPSFDDLVRMYGSRQAVVQHLLDSGFKPEDIEWKIGVPYYLIRLFMAGIKLTNPTMFSSVVSVYERLALLRDQLFLAVRLIRLF